MPPPSKAKWTTDPRQITSASSDDGSFVARVPLYDNGVLQGWFSLGINANREMLLRWEAADGSTPLNNFQAWSTK